ncbi:MAG TPA: phasin family protein [Reyranella sp.]|nr:phasin family protein [Reyranella sp.]
MAKSKAKASAPKPAAKRAAPAPRKPQARSARAVKAAQLTAGTVNHTITEGTKIMTNDTIQRVQATQKDAADRFQAVFGDVNERAKTAMEKNGKLVEEMSEFTKGNVEALVASSKVVAKGVETIGQEVAEYGRRSFEEASAALKSFAEVKSPTDFFKLQSDFARSAFDSFVSETSKVSEQVLKIAGEVAEPITSRYSVAAERVKNIAA